MKRKLAAALLALCLVISLAPRASSAEAVYFTGVNSTLLPLQRDTMPVHVGALLYVPYKVFSYLGVYGSPSIEDKALYLYRGGASTRSVNFDVAASTAVDFDNHVYEGVTARIINNTFYVPLDFVCTYFNLRYSVVNCEPAPIIRLKSADDNAILNDKTFIGIYSEQMYSEYNALTAAVITTQPSNPTETPDISQPQRYESVTMYLSFHGLSSGFAGDMLDTLSPGYRCCFFITEEDILYSPGLIRRVAGSGHTIGLWLTDCTYDEYLNISELLFEAVKMKTVLVSSDNAQDAAVMANEHGLVFWPVSRSYGEDATSADITSKLPTAFGTRQNLLFSCTENITGLLPDVLDALLQGGYSVASITETVAPVK